MATVGAGFSMSLEGCIAFSAHLENAPVVSDDPTIVQGERVTHLAFRVGR